MSTRSLPSASSQPLARLGAALGSDKLAALARTAERLHATFPHPDELDRNVVLAMYGGGKDSTFMLACVRAVHLMLCQAYGRTFRLRVATNRHAGMPAAVQRNMARAYAALEMDGDPDVELLVVDDGVVRPFDAALEIPEPLRERNRTDVLMAGHRCGADARPTFCNACNLSMQNALLLAAGHGANAHLVVTGDSPAEQLRYAAWARRAERRITGAPRAERGEAAAQPGFRAFLSTLDGIGERLNEQVFDDLRDEVDARRLRLDAMPHEPAFFSIYDDVRYSAGDHWELLTGFLGFAFDEIAFSFTESDCGNPGLMAHLHGLRHERLLGEGYAAGVREYADYAIDLMGRKEFPPVLIDVMRRRYDGRDGFVGLRRRLDAYAAQAFRLDETQLVCMVHSPFAGRGQNLERWLAAEHPACAGRAGRIRVLLDGTAEYADEPELDTWLTAVSGLGLEHRRALFRAPLVPTRLPGAAGGDPISIILRGDPHRGSVRRRAPSGVLVHEIISGR